MALPDPALTDLKRQLVEAWDRHAPEPTTVASGVARFQSLREPGRPRAGLAIGHALDPKTRKPRLELRVTAASGPNFNHAKNLAAVARAQGVDAVLRFFSQPIIRTDPAKATVTAAFSARRRPLHIGASVAHEKGSAGSLGAFVLAPDGAKSGDHIHQPGALDTEILTGATRVGTLGPFVRAQEGRRNRVDAAVAILREAEGLGNIAPEFTPDLGRAISGLVTPEEL